MAEPFIFIGTHGLQEGKIAEFEESFADLVRVVEENEPRMIAFNGYANEEGTEVAVVQVHPDTDSMEHHMQVVAQHIEDAYANLLEETTSIQVFGHLSEAAREMMADPEFKSDAKVREAKLKAFRKKIEKAEVPQEIKKSLGELQSKFPPGQGILLRSSGYVATCG